MDTPTPVATAVPDDDSGVENLPPIEGKLSPPKYPNMDSNLNQIVQQVESGETTARAAAADAPLHSEESVAVTLYITEGYADAVVEYLERNGVSPRNVGIDYIEAYVPVSLLPEASTQEGVISIRTIVPPQPAQDTVVSQAASVHGATAWHDAGYKGQNVKVGVIDTGFEDYSSHIGSEVPQPVEVRCYLENTSVPTSNLSDCENGDVHGTAVTEALFDMAPEATFYIASPITWGDLVDAVDWMVEHDVDVINMSVNWTWSGPGDGTSHFSNSPLKTVDSAVDGGIVWLNSAGNAGNSTWYGTFSSPDGNGFHNFNGLDECNEFTVDAGERVLTHLRWDDSWGGASKDLNLFLFSGSLSGITDAAIENNLIDGSIDEQSGQSDDIPFEFITGFVSVGGTYCLAIGTTLESPPSWIQLQMLTWQPLEHYIQDRSLAEPADSAKAGFLAVGAAAVSNPSEIEAFSSRGPTLDDRIKPDIVGADNVHSAVRGEAFEGTSQASPHVAGLAVLVKQRFPDYTPEQVASYLENHAEERGDIGEDNIWGHGFARLLASDVATPVPSPTPSTDSCVEAVDADGTISGSWAADCESSHSDRSGHYARYYTFSLTESAEVTITLESSTDPYLYLRDGAGREGSVLCENDDYGLAVTGLSCSRISSSLDASTDSGLVASLAEGSYTVEATTFDAAATGDFTLTLTTGAATTQPTPPPIPSPTPVPLPPDYDIKDYACTEDDLAELEGYSFEDENGPNIYGEGRYSGVIGRYWNSWVNEEADSYIFCTATQYDSVQNARWIGLNYSGIIQTYGAHSTILYDGQAPSVSPYIGDEMLALWLGYQYEGEEDSYTAAEVRFLDSATRTLSRVFYYFRNNDEYPNLDQAAEIARNIESRVFPTEEDESESQRTRNSNGMLGALERIR